MKKVVLAITIVAIAMLVGCVGTPATKEVKKDSVNVKTDTVKLDTVKIQPVKK
jgi:PBP1b-binding outer membrane lipoprotein LpoB